MVWNINDLPHQDAYHMIIEGFKLSPFKLILISTKMQFAFRKHTMHARLFPKILHGMETSHCFYAKWVRRPMMNSLWAILEIRYTCFLLTTLCMNWPFHIKLLPIVSFNCNWGRSSLSFVMNRGVLPKPSIISTSCTRYHPVSTWVQWCTPCCPPIHVITLVAITSNLVELINSTLSPI
jgi:hypothetical protein